MNAARYELGVRKGLRVGFFHDREKTVGVKNYHWKYKVSDRFGEVGGVGGAGADGKFDFTAPSASGAAEGVPVKEEAGLLSWMTNVKGEKLYIVHQYRPFANWEERSIRRYHAAFGREG